MDKETFEIEIGGRMLKIKLTDWASQASGSCLVQYGETELIATATLSQKDTSAQDFFPLSVDYEEKFYAAGKIYGSRFLKRESRPTDDAILTSRMIDRAVRPLFPKDFKKEVQVIVTCLTWDAQNDPDIIAMIGASFALATSQIPWNGPLAAVRIGKINGEFIINPSYDQRVQSSMDLTLAGIEKDGKVLINMVEMGAQQVAEEDVLQAVKLAEKPLTDIINFQKEIAQKISKPKEVFDAAVHLDVASDIKEFLGDKLQKAVDNAPAGEKNMDAIGTLKEETIAFIKEKYPDQGKEKQVLYYFEKETERILIENILEKNKRPDGRTPEEIRPLTAEVAGFPKNHGH